MQERETPTMTGYDFLVIGAGISGASAAFSLAKRGKTLLLEAETLPGYHSTGRSAALYTPNFGSPVVRKLNMAGHGFFATPPEGFSERPLLTPRQSLTLARPGEEAKLAAVLACSTAEHPILPISAEEAYRLAPILRREVIGAAALEPGVTDMDVAAIHQGFLRGFRLRGGELRCAAGVSALHREAAGWRVEAGGEIFHAGVVVNAAGAWGDAIAQLAGIAPIGLVAKRRTIIGIETTMQVSDMPLIEFAGEEGYLKPDTGRILASPGDETPVAPQDIQPEEWDIAVTVDWLQRHTVLDIRRVANSWAGLRTFVADHAPVVGFDPEHPGFFWLVGQGGYGIMHSPTLGRATTSLIETGELPADLLALGLTRDDLSPARLRAIASA
ncbi:MAG: FAD-dependent oxidoreductase [Rhizobiales bacterium PAR1]|nr:MAG: FAD-dependent oxidoreductase [Rhizobiales bacterium PAR1]